MNAKRIIGIIVLLIGVFYTAVPHNYHISSGLDFGMEHTMHIAIGVILILIGLVLEWKARPSTKISSVKTSTLKK